MEAAAAPAAAGAAEDTIKAELWQQQEGPWQQLMFDALHANAPSSSFACSGRLQTPFLCPDIYVEGVGRLGLALSKEQAATVKAAAERAPHSKGLHTVVDTAVRDAFQPVIDKHLEQLVAACRQAGCDELGALQAALQGLQRGQGCSSERVSSELDG
ncbi:hypothetical protein COO60DRAFT_1639603 [Scenedesmus sp. NREL 46B-D3]|nr:hypothetical protein COO60DRAFT_1639603 [Scenedesmus sp. NREL 46B-D3]